MAMNGTDILLLVNTGTPGAPVYEAVGSQRNADFPETTEAIDVSSKDSRATRVLPGRYKASLSMDALYVPTDAGYLALHEAMTNGTMILVAREVLGTVVETADAVVTDLSTAFPDQKGATVSISLEIDGFWTEVGS